MCTWSTVATVTRALVLMMVVAACASPSAPPPPSCACSDGKICEGDRCVDPWRYGSPTFSTCPAEPRATPESLAEKAALYDARAIALHTHPKLPWVMDVAIAPDVDPESATAADVTVWRSGENDGLFSGLVLAAEAYRYAVTHEPAARDALALLLRGEQQRMAITGVPGLFTRQLIPPGVPNLACPTDPAAYMPSPDKRGNRWVQIGADGCAQTTDATGTFVSTSHCGLTDFAASLEPFAHDTLATFAASLDQIELWQGPDGCESNWNDISMLLAAFHHVLWSRDDVAPYRDAFTAVMTAAPNTRGPLVEHNAWYDIMWAAQKPLGPSTDGPAYAAVEDAVCQLRQFPRSNHLAAHDTSQLAPHACDDRFQRSLAATPFPIADRCAATFAWWGNPYERTSCSDEPTLVQQPAGYLLPYWMGRYYGFISARQ